MLQDATIMTLLPVLIFLLSLTIATAKPLSNPYIAFRTDPNQPQNNLPNTKQYLVPDFPSHSNRRPNLYDEGSTLDMEFLVGHAQHYVSDTETILDHPILSNVLASVESTQVIYCSHAQHLHLFHSKNTNKLLSEPPDFPKLMESSYYRTSPILLDANGDGSLDVLLSDYDGGLSVLGINSNGNYRSHFQVPRLNVRKHWLVALTDKDDSTTTNTTNNSPDDDPLHSYFEYSYNNNDNNNNEKLIKGESAHVLTQSADSVRTVQEKKRAAKVPSRRLLQSTTQNRRLEELPTETEPQQDEQEEDPHEFKRFVQDNNNNNMLQDDFGIPELDTADAGVDDMMLGHQHVPDQDDDYDRGGDEEELYYPPHNDDDYPMMDDAYGRYRYGDDIYGDSSSGGGAHSDYYDSKHYLPLPPHILTTPVVAEVPRLYGTEETDVMVIVAVSYYLDEDEYQGHVDYQRFEHTDQNDQTEVQRGMYVASAIMGYILTDYGGRWTGQTHLDMSTDYTAPENVTIVGTLPEHPDPSRKIAMCLSSPTVADLDGDGVPEVLIGTSMGMLYAFDARNFVQKSDWTVQVSFPIEQRVIVEDVVGNTNLEVFVADIGGNILCLDSAATKLWHRNLLSSLDLKDPIAVQATSPLMLGDVNGDGTLDLVQVVFVNERTFVFALQAANGLDLAKFPMELDGTPHLVERGNVHEKLPLPVLVDLHADQSFLNDYLHRKNKPVPTSSKGLHVIVPLSEDLYVIQGHNGATQKINIGEPVVSVQIDDIHNTGNLDLVLATAPGKIITLESSTSYHPLNVWRNGELRGPGPNQHAHGYSSSTGVFVHDISKYNSIQGVYVPITFEIFDNRHNIANEPDRQKYKIEIRDGDHSKRVLFRETYNATGTYTERVYIRYGPGYYNLFVVLQSTHGILYSDNLLVQYNIGFLDGLGMLLWLPLILACSTIVVCHATRPDNWEDDDGTYRRDNSGTQGILGRALPS